MNAQAIPAEEGFMSPEEFVTKINTIDDLEIKEEKKDSFVVFNKKQGQKYKISRDSIRDINWENIHSVLCGREPIIMDGITRIVGYFSKTSNWNKSKIGELKDRRKGNYKV